MIAPTGLPEPTAQQEEGPHVPPHGGLEVPLPDRDAKVDRAFFTFFESHLGHFALRLKSKTFLSRENLSSQSLHMYS